MISTDLKKGVARQSPNSTMTYPDGLYLSEIHVTAKGNPSEPFEWLTKCESGVWYVRRPGWFGRFVWERIIEVVYS